MKSRIKTMLFRLMYIIPIIIIHIMSFTKMLGDGFQTYLFILNIPLSLCMGIAIGELIHDIIQFKYFLKQRKKVRVMGLDVCPKCQGVGWLDWVEQIVGKKEGRITDGEEN